MGDTADPRLEVVLGLFLALTWIFTLLRVFVRCAISKSWGADDSLLVAALVSFTTYVGCALSGIPYGIGRHASDVTATDVPQGLMFWWLFELFYTVTTVLLRCSIALFILRICAKREHKLIIYITTGVVLLFSTFYFFLVIFQCHPVSYYWTRYDPNPEGTCIDPMIFPAASYAHSAVSASADWVLGILPVWLIWDLKMNIRTKISVGMLLGFGMIAGIAAIIRVPFIHTLTFSDEFFFATVDVAIWSTVEPGLGIIATAACVLRPLMKRFYGLSSYGTSRIRDTNTHPSTWHNERVNTIRSKSFPNDTKRQVIMEDDIEMDGIVTCVLSNDKGERERDWSRRNPGTVHRSRTGNESEEELTGERRGIVIHKTVEIRTHDTTLGQSKAESISSVDSET